MPRSSKAPPDNDWRRSESARANRAGGLGCVRFPRFDVGATGGTRRSMFYAAVALQRRVDRLSACRGVRWRPDAADCDGHLAATGSGQIIARYLLLVVSVAATAFLPSGRAARSEISRAITFDREKGAATIADGSRQRLAKDSDGAGSRATRIRSTVNIPAHSAKSAPPSNRARFARSSGVHTLPPMAPTARVGPLPSKRNSTRKWGSNSSVRADNTSPGDSKPEWPGSSHTGSNRG